MLLDLQIASAKTGLPEETDFQQWLETCFVETEGSVLVRIVDADESAELNQAFRQKQGPTNVLSFPFDVPIEIENDHLGDLVMCAQVIQSEAEDQDKQAMHHWAHMLIHGVLHLQGYDHLEPGEAEAMEAQEVNLLNKLNITNPYD